MEKFLKAPFYYQNGLFKPYFEPFFKGFLFIVK